MYPMRNLSLIHIFDKHSPVIDSVEWDKGWSQEKTVTVKAHDTAVSYTHLDVYKRQDVKWANEFLKK